MRQQHYIPAVFARGGTSKGVFFLRRDLPVDQEGRDAVFLSALGSPDPNGRQLDGMGGGLSSLSKAVYLDVSDHPEADVDYTFAQVSVDEALVEYGANCGNLASAVGPVAVECGLIDVPDGTVSVRIHATNTGQLIRSTFEVRGGRPVVDGDLALPGVSGTGAPVELEFLDPAGSLTPGLLPTGHVMDELEVDGVGMVTASLVDATNPVIFVAATTLGLRGLESVDELEADPALMGTVEKIRRAGAVAMGLARTAADAQKANPKIAVVAAPGDFVALDGTRVAADDFDVSIRIVPLGRWHRAVTVTGALCLATAIGIDRSVPAGLSAPRSPDSRIRIGQPSGVVEVSSSTRREGDSWTAASASLFRTARILMRGEVSVLTER